MTTPTNIRFTDEESLAIDAYAETKGLRRTSAVRELVRIGLQNANESGLNVAAALHALQTDVALVRDGQLHLSELLLALVDDEPDEPPRGRDHLGGRDQGGRHQGTGQRPRRR